MITFESGHLESSDDGGCFPKRPYYPLVAGNGTDAILLGLGGFPDDPNWRCYSMQLPFRTCLGWYKTARKDYLYANPRYGVSSYGSSVAVAAPTTLLGVGKERNLGIREPHQSFDPRTRVLTSTFLIYESRGTVPAKIKVSSFLNDEHVLVERYEVMAAPESGFRLGFQLDTPNASDLHELCVYPQTLNFLNRPGGFQFRYSYASPEIPDGIAATWTDAEDWEIEEENGRPIIQWTKVVPAGEAVTRYLAVVDAWDDQGYEREIDRLVEKTRAIRFEGMRREHCAKVAGGDSAHVSLPEKDLEYLYDYSLYILEASFDASSGFLPMGILASAWQNAMFWDSWFASMAWLGCNRPDRARQMSHFYRDKLPEARLLAQTMDGEGARFAWTTNRDHFEKNPERVVQFHNNAVMALQALQVYHFTGDERFLTETFDTIEESLIFLTQKLVKIEKGVAILRDCAGLDESTADLKGTDTWTAATYARALLDYLAVCQSQGRSPFQKNLDEIATMVLTALDRNVDEDGVLQSFAGGKTPHWGSLIYHLFPEHPSCSPTLAALSRYDAELDSYNSHGVMGYRCRIFTWTEFWIARLLAAEGKNEGWERLRQCAKFTDGFGSFPERVFYGGELLKQPFLTAHASYLWAVNSLLLNRVGKRLSVLTNLPEDWTDVSFDNLTTNDGLKVSARLSAGKIVQLDIVNQNLNARAIDLEYPGAAVSGITLQTGEIYQLR